MNRIEFLSELEQRLSGIPEDERQSAIQYYADYLADAGEENEAEAIRELGSPEKVAESIKADYYGTEFDESRFDHKDYMEKYGQRSSQGTGSGNTSGGRPGADGYGYGQENGQENGQGNGPAQKNAPWTSRGLKRARSGGSHILFLRRSCHRSNRGHDLRRCRSCNRPGAACHTAGRHDRHRYRDLAVRTGPYCNGRDCKTLYDRISCYDPRICKPVQASDLWKGGVNIL